MKLYFRHTLRTQWHWEISIIIRYLFHMYNIFHIKGKDNVWNSKDKWVRTRERERKAEKEKKTKKRRERKRRKARKREEQLDIDHVVLLRLVSSARNVEGALTTTLPWCLDQRFIFIMTRVAKVVRGHGGPPLKSLDLDENFKPEHTLFCRELRFVAIYALFGDLLSKKVPLWVKNSVSWARSALLHGIYYTFYWVKFANLRLRTKTTHLSQKL